MQSSGSITEEPKSDVGTILTFRSLLDADAMSQALLSDIASGALDDAYRGLGLKQVTFWIQRAPEAAVVMWEGTDIETMLERFAASSHPVLSRWRGQLRVLSGPEVAEEFWDASRHRLLSWASDEQGAESEVTIFRGAKQVEIYRQLASDFQSDPSLLGILDRIRRRQGFTRIETWHQQTQGDDVVLTLVEAHDLDSARAQIAVEGNDLDKRTMKIMRSVLLQGPAPATAKLLARWQA